MVRGTVKDRGKENEGGGLRPRPIFLFTISLNATLHKCVRRNGFLEAL